MSTGLEIDLQVWRLYFIRKQSGCYKMEAEQNTYICGRDNIEKCEVSYSEKY